MANTKFFTETMLKHCSPAPCTQGKTTRTSIISCSIKALKPNIKRVSRLTAFGM